MDIGGGVSSPAVKPNKCTLMDVGFFAVSAGVTIVFAALGGFTDYRRQENLPIFTVIFSQM